MRTLLTLISLFFAATILPAQDVSFKIFITSDKTTEPVVMKVSASGTKMVMEPQQMTPEGNMKFLVDNNASKQYILMDMNGQKMAMAFDMAELNKAAGDKDQTKITVTNETKVIDTYKCKKIIAESEEHHTEIWITEGVGVEYSDFFKMMASAQNQNSFASMPELKNIKGFPIETVSKDKKKNSTSTLKIREISKARVNPEIFSMKGYQVMAAPVTK